MMKKKDFLTRIVLALWLGLISIATVDAQQAEIAVGQYQLQTDTLNSAVLKELRTITVQLPKSYSSRPDKKYPVIYRLDGKDHLPLMNGVLERLQEVDAAPEVIIVAIENTDRMRDFYPTVNQEPAGPVGLGGGAGKFLNFIKRELIPFVNQKYRTHDFKVIAGASAGGAFVLYALQTEPELFQAHLAYSPAIWWDYGATAITTKAFFTRTKTLNNYLYMNIGEESGVMRQRYDDLLQFIQANQPKGFQFVSEEFSTVPHGLTSVAGIFTAYHRLFLPLQMPLSAYNGAIPSIAAYYQQLSSQYGEQIRPPEAVVRGLGYHVVNEGKLEAAIQLFKYAIELHPDKAEAYNGLAYGYEQNKQYQDALVQVTKALALSNAQDEGFAVFQARKQRLEQLLAQ